MIAQRVFLLALTALAFVTTSAYDSCSPPLLDNPGFDIWCGDNELCGWEVEAGEVARVSTWHERDYGVRLQGDPAIISQVQDLTHWDATCYVVDLVADADDGADLTLELDFFDDGSADVSHPIPADNWKHVHYDLSTPAWYQGVRFRVVKTGSARAVVAQIRVERGTPGEDCTGDPLSVLRPDGVQCTSSDQCESALCDETDGVCQ